MFKMNNSNFKYSFLEFSFTDSGMESPVSCLSMPYKTALENKYQILLTLTLHDGIKYPSTNIPVSEKASRLQIRFLTNTLKDIMTSSFYIENSLTCYEYTAKAVVHTHTILSLTNPEMALNEVLRIRDLLKELGFMRILESVQLINSSDDTTRYVYKPNTKIIEYRKFFYTERIKEPKVEKSGSVFLSSREKKLPLRKGAGGFDS